MNVGKMMVIGLVMCMSMVMGGSLEPKWVSEHRTYIQKIMSKAQRLYLYGGVKNDMIWIGQFSSSLYNLMENGEIWEKTVIKQKIPCYVVPEHWGEYHSHYGKWVKDERRFYKKINKNTIEIRRKDVGVGGQAKAYFGKKDRIRSYYDPRVKKAKVLLGDSAECLKRPNSEVWTVYWKLRGKWVPIAEETMRVNFK